MSRSTFGKYVLLRKLASGGMGEVFLAKQRGPSGFEKLLVIKRILSHHLDKRDYLDMFFSEAKLVARLNHNNIIQIQEMGEIDGDYYIAMEYVRGKSLRDIIDELRAEGRMLPLPHVIDLAIKLCEGLGYAHQARDIRGRPMNIVHRDINPHNVLVSYNGDLKLIDFGIAKSEMTSVHTATGTIKGKFVYMSPEQSAADPIDRRSDIFSLGIVLYEMTVLENPFVRQNVVLSLEAIQRHAIPPPSTKRNDAGPLDAILLRALEKRPEDRYQTATEMRDELRNLFRTTIVQPAEEDISIFLHELFRADIDEEDRLLAEADRATTPPGAAAAAAANAEGPTLAQFDQPAPPPSAMMDEQAHSSDEVGARPAASFGDEEPTLSGNLEGIAQRSREISHPKQHPANGEAPNGSDDIAPTPGEEMSEHPTRSDRIPGRKNSFPSGAHEAPPIAASGPLMPIPSSHSNPALGGPIPGGAIGGTATLPTRSSSSSPPPYLGPTAARPAAFDEPINGTVHEPTREMQRNESIAPFPPRAERPVMQPLNAAITDEDSSAALSQPTPPWRRVGLWVAGLLVFLATAVAGFVATRAVTRSNTGPRADLEQVMPSPIGEEQPIDVSGVKKEENPPTPAPDPQLKEPIKQELVGPVLNTNAEQVAPKVEEPKLSPKEEKRRAREEEKKRKAEEAAAAKAAREEEKRKKAEAAGEKSAIEQAAKLAREDEKRRKAEAEKADRQARDEEKRRKAEADRAERLAREDEKKKKVEADKAERLAREEEKRKKAEADKAARDEEKRKRAEADKAAREEEKRKKAEADAREDKTDRDDEKRKKAEADREAKEALERAKAAAEAEKNSKEAAEPKEGELAAKTNKESEKSAPSRFGTLTVSTSVECNVEVDGKPVGTSPSVIHVKKPQGKIKLFGPSVEIVVMLAYKVEDNGISVKLESNPWAIAKHNGISLGKTPQNVPAEPRHRFSLLRPGQVAPFVISLLWNPKSG